MKHIEQNGICLHFKCPVHYKDAQHVTARVMKYTVCTSVHSHVV